MVSLQPYQVDFDLRVAVLARPYVEWRCRNLIDERNSKAEAREVYTLYVMLACIARFYSDVVVIRAVKVSELRWSLFAAIRADDSSEFPG